MSNITWGPEILVGGVRPAWLSKDTYFRWYGGSMGDKWWDLHSYGGVNGVGFNWEECVDAIRLPADHFAYVAINKGFEPWGGGDAAPDDWDGGDVLRRGGVSTRPEPWAAPSAHNQRWSHYLDGHQGRFADIIGYHRRTETPADTVTVPRLTLVEIEEARKAYFNDNNRGDSSAEFYARRWGLIREETTAERFTRETGHAITPAVEAALAWDRK